MSKKHRVILTIAGEPIIAFTILSDLIPLHNIYIATYAIYI